MQGLLIPLLLLATGGLAVGWNLQVFLRAEPRDRLVTELSFLPGPIAARALALGQQGTVCKWRLITSYPYFRYQVDRRDDSVAGSDDHRGAFRRLFETLVALDPLFEPLYIKGVTALGAVVGDHQGELELSRAGIDNLPDPTPMWLNYMSCLVTAYDLERRQPELFAEILQGWIEAEEAEGAGGSVIARDWADAMRRRSELGILQLAHWGEWLQYHRTGGPESAELAMVLGGMRRFLAEKQRERLQAVVDAYAETMKQPPPSWADCLSPQWVQRSFTANQSHYHASLPWRVDATDRLRLLPDPYGHAWRLVDGCVTSVGLERDDFARHVGRANAAYLRAGRRHGRWAESVEEALEWLLPDRFELPADAHWILADGALKVSYATSPESAPWSVDELLAAAGMQATAAPSPAWKGIP